MGQHNRIFPSAFHLVDCHIRIVHQFFHTACRIRIRGNTSADSQNFQRVILFRLIHIHNLPAYIFRQIFRGQQIISRENYSKLFPTVSRRVSVISHAGRYDSSHPLKGQIPFPVSVKLIVKLEIIQVENNQRKGTVFILFKFFLKHLIKTLSIQKPGQIIRPGFRVSFLVQPGILNRDGSDGADRG